MATEGLSLAVPSTALRWLGRERRAIDEHPMHDDGELAGERYLCFLHAGPLGDPHRPALEVVQPLTGLVMMMWALS